MENYEGAYRQRHRDTEVLHGVDRATAAMHLGGCAVECLLKAMILAQIPNPNQRQWHTEENPQPHGIKRPNHDLQEALKQYRKLYDRALKDPQVLKWFNAVEFPSQHFIDLRYSDTEPSPEGYKIWWDAYTKLCRWLEKQKTQL
jgi:hypothetical protein